ncbi:MAG: cyclic nucleotide-binding domain-containing protein [Deltaproteobacteria bacterium]|nr:cyclic nucleotide-binding domain-containing protein [Deltaproteobacteria bacterium]
MDAKDRALPTIRLNYRKGDLIMKEGDYGVSIYRVKKGHVRVTQQQGEMEVVLATLGPGEYFGEMVFLNKSVETRSASVRAMDEVEVEVMHPVRLSKEYDGMPPILRYITNQTLNRLNRLNKLYAQLLKKKELESRGPTDPGVAQRKYFRKTLDQTCIYKPVRSSDKVRLQGRITDISVGGLGMEVSSRNALNVRHEPGEEFIIHTTLPSGREIELIGKIQTVSRNAAPGRIQLGLKFTRLTGEATKTLGFFMMS